MAIKKTAGPCFRQSIRSHFQILDTVQIIRTNRAHIIWSLPESIRMSAREEKATPGGIGEPGICFINGAILLFYFAPFFRRISMIS